MTRDDFPCTVHFTLKENIKGPAHMYYYIENYFTSHSTYQKSRNYFQTLGVAYSTERKKICGATLYSNSQLGYTTSFNGTPLVGSEPANPCGLMAHAFFQDLFLLCESEH